jgi:hypothetical protein
LEFADQFGEAVHKLMNPPKPPRTLVIKTKLKNKAQETTDEAMYYLALVREM